MSDRAEWVAKLRQKLAEYRVPDGGVDNVPESCVVILRATVEKLLNAADEAVAPPLSVPPLTVERLTSILEELANARQMIGHGWTAGESRAVANWLLPKLAGAPSQERTP